MSIGFKIRKSDIMQEISIIQPSISNDKRGNIWTSYIEEVIDKLLPNNINFKHDKFSRSKKNVLRGIHGDEKSWKLVTCVYGSIQQVIVDCRQDSKTYAKSESFEINEDNQISVLIPPNFGNAYFVKSENALYHYKLAYPGSYIDADDQFSFKWNNPTFGIKWDTSNPILSDRDK